MIASQETGTPAAADAAPAADAPAAGTSRLAEQERNVLGWMLERAQSVRLPKAAQNDGRPGWRWGEAGPKIGGSEPWRARRVAGAMLPPIAAAVAIGWATPVRAAPETFPPHFPIGVAVTNWGQGVRSDVVQPGTTTPCDSSHACQITASGLAAGEFGIESGHAHFTIVETIDFSRSRANGTGGLCYPAGGHLSLTPERVQATLVVDFQGEACQWSSSALITIFTGSWVADTASTGRFTGTDGVGTINLGTPTADISATGARLSFFFTGVLQIRR